MSKAAVIKRLCEEHLIALLRADSADEMEAMARALQKGGINHWELPLTCPAVPDYLAKVSLILPDFQFGLGTVINVDTARRGILAGARFISTPSLQPQVILLCRRQQIPVICGVHSPAEMDAALLAGADALKLYPSETRFGPTHMREMREAYPEARLFPVGGVTSATVGDFFAAGADAAFVSSCLHDPTAKKPATPKTLTRIARELVAAQAVPANPIPNS
jgi:2-dehydro-3-deoxyphosphogluconate aldolase/(4S)-4-hydroxy-2-oxoglutarate aldolase